MVVVEADTCSNDQSYPCVYVDVLEEAADDTSGNTADEDKDRNADSVGIRMEKCPHNFFTIHNCSPRVLGTIFVRVMNEVEYSINDYESQGIQSGCTGNRNYGIAGRGFRREVEC